MPLGEEIRKCGPTWPTVLKQELVLCLTFICNHPIGSTELHKSGTRGPGKLSSFIKLKIPTKTKGTVNTLCEIGRRHSSFLLGVVSPAPRWMSSICHQQEWISEWITPNLRSDSCPASPYGESCVVLARNTWQRESDKTDNGADSCRAAELETTSYHCIMALGLFPTSQRMQPERDWVIPH